jgi:hypothetical protein
MTGKHATLNHRLKLLPNRYQTVTLTVTPNHAATRTDRDRIVINTPVIHRPEFTHPC